MQLTSAYPFVPFWNGDSVLAFLDLEDEASSEAFLLVAAEISRAQAKLAKPTYFPY